MALKGAGTAVMLVVQKCKTPQIEGIKGALTGGAEITLGCRRFLYGKFTTLTQKIAPQKYSYKASEFPWEESSFGARAFIAACSALNLSAAFITLGLVKLIQNVSLSHSTPSAPAK